MGFGSATAYAGPWFDKGMGGVQDWRGTGKNSFTERICHFAETERAEAGIAHEETGAGSSCWIVPVLVSGAALTFMLRGGGDLMA